MKIQQNEILVKRVLQNYFNFSEVEAEKFIINSNWEVRENYLKIFNKKWILWLKNFLQNQFVWNYDDLVFDYQKYLKYLELDENKFYWKILDIGSAWGNFEYMAKRKNSFQNSEITWIDYNKNFVQKWQKAWLDIRFMNAMELDFEEEKFDLVISIGSMPHLLYQNDDEKFEKDIIKFVNWVYKILKKWWEFRVFAFNSSFSKIGQIIQKTLKNYKNFKNFNQKLIIDENNRFENDNKVSLYIFTK